jgi:pimeloyl-ACP methyl ester carboxylesterase
VRTGPPRPGGALVLVHGVIVSSRYLVPLAAELARDRHVLVPDLPGYGLSDGRPGDLPALADAVVAAARALGRDRVALVGNSFGAQVVVEAALRHPRLVERLVLIGADRGPGGAHPRAPVRALAAQRARRAPLRPARHGPRPRRPRPRRRDAAAAHHLADHLEAKLPHVGQPTLVIRGGRDRVVPDAWAHTLTRLLPDARLALLPGYAHMPHWSGALAVAPLVRELVP